jgi:hypothetical protein
LIYNFRVAYLSAAEENNHQTIDDFPDIHDAVVPKQRFKDPYPNKDLMTREALVPFVQVFALQPAALQSTPNPQNIRRPLTYPLPPLCSDDVRYPPRHRTDELALRSFAITF